MTSGAPMERSTELFDSIIAKVERQKIPLNAHIDLSYRCNLKCVHCYCQGLSPDFSRGEPEMSEGELLRLVDELADIGSLFLTLSGGEPLLHGSFFTVARHARKRRFCLSILTNGMLVDEEMARKIAGLSPKTVELSIYGANAAVHDSITGVTGSFDKLSRAVRLLKAQGLRVLLKSVIMKPNMRESYIISKAATDMGADEHVSTLEVGPKNDRSIDVQRLQLSGEDLKELLSNDPDPLPGASEALGQKAKDRLICGCGILGTYISPYGDVYPCIQLLIPMGNIRRQRFSDIWRARSKLRDELDSIYTYADMPVCRDCEFAGICKKCLGTAYLETGDMRACHETQRSVLKMGYEVYCKQGGMR